MLSAPQAEGTSERLSPEPQADEILSPEPQAVDLSFVPQAELMEVLEVFLFQSFKLESAIIIPRIIKVVVINDPLQGRDIMTKILWISFFTYRLTIFWRF